MPGPAHDQDRLPGLDEVVDDLDRPVHGPPDAAGQPDDLAVAVADGADAVERPLDAGAVVVAERADVLDDEGDVGLVDLALEERHLRIREARLRPPAEVHDDLDEGGPVRQGMDGGDDLGRQGREQRVEVVDRFALAVRLIPRWPPSTAQRTPAGTRAGSATRTRVSFISSVTLAIESKPASSSRRSIGDS